MAWPLQLGAVRLLNWLLVGGVQTWGLDSTGEEALILVGHLSSCNMHEDSLEVSSCSGVKVTLGFKTEASLTYM